MKQDYTLDELQTEMTALAQLFDSVTLADPRMGLLDPATLQPLNKVAAMPALDAAGRGLKIEKAADGLRTVIAQGITVADTPCVLLLGMPLPRNLQADGAEYKASGVSTVKNADGSPSHNLFNIKAGKRWAGDTVSTATTEYSNGVATRENARFRSYGSYAESFCDYARLISSNPRYAAVLGQDDAAAFARGLQSAGYATDPLYADKLARIINGNTLRVALSSSASPSSGISPLNLNRSCKRSG